MWGCDRMSTLVSVVGVLQGLPGMLMSRQVILLTVLLGYPMGVRGAIVQFGRSLMVLVVRAVVVTSGHV